MKGDINLKINKKAALLLSMVVGAYAFADYVSLIDAKSSGGIIVEDTIDTTPIGSVMMWGSATPPEGWLEMNGGPTAGYPELAKIYGSNLPDLRGQFVRGWDNSKGIDSGRSLKSSQGQSVQALTFKGNPLPNHKHTSDADGVTTYSHAHDGNLDGSRVVTGYDRSTVGRPSTSSVSAGTPTGVIQGTGVETRPTNIALMYIVKAEMPSK